MALDAPIRRRAEEFAAELAVTDGANFAAIAAERAARQRATSR